MYASSPARDHRLELWTSACSNSTEHTQLCRNLQCCLRRRSLMPPNECARGVNFRCSNMCMHASGGEQPYVMTLGSDLSPSRSSWIPMLDVCAEEVPARHSLNAIAGTDGRHLSHSPSRAACADRWSLMTCPTCSHAYVLSDCSPKPFPPPLWDPLLSRNRPAPLPSQRCVNISHHHPSPPRCYLFRAAIDPLLPPRQPL